MREHEQQHSPGYSDLSQPDVSSPATRHDADDFLSIVLHL